MRSLTHKAPVTLITNPKSGENSGFLAPSTTKSSDGKGLEPFMRWLVVVWLIRRCRLLRSCRGLRLARRTSSAWGPHALGTSPPETVEAALPALPAHLAEHLLQFLALLRRQRLPHGQVVVNPRLLTCESRVADFA